MNGLDRRLLPLLPEGRGVFVEAGANDGIKQSNTHGLERALGWSGLLVEPVPRLAAECRLRRPRSVVANAALVAPEADGGTIEILDLDLMPAVVSERDAAWVDRHVREAEITGVQPVTLRVIGCTLSGLIDEAGTGEIDLLSFDVEGFEVPALSGLAIERHAPKVVVVETTQPESVSARLGPRYREPSRTTANDVVWIREDWRRRLPASATEVLIVLGA